MLILIGALKSITRAKGRNVLIGIIVLTIAVSSSIALAISEAAKKAKEEGLSQQTITATISRDLQKIMESMGTGTPQQGAFDRSQMQELMTKYPELTQEQLEEYAKSENVKDFYYTLSTSLDGNTIDPYTTEDDSEDDTESDQPPKGGFASSERGFVRVGNMSMGDFTLTGYSSLSAMTAYESGGENEITDGNNFDTSLADNNALITQELATWSNLAVGSSFTLQNPDDETQTFTFTVCGIYKNSSSQSSDAPRFGTAQDPINNIVVSAPTLSAIKEQATTDETDEADSFMVRTQSNSTFVFENTQKYDAFEQELRDGGLSEYYALNSADIDSYEQALVPLEKLRNFSRILLLIVLIVGAIILVVLNIFNIRERKYEVGVLTAIGVKKWKVATQFVCELMSVTLVAIILGTGIGAIASIPVANKLLADQITAQETSQDDTNTQPKMGEPNRVFGSGFGNMFGGATTPVEYVDSINATINFTILLQLIAIGVALTIISSLAGIIFVLRYDPLKILANRS